jgi:hypothetical protein
MASISEAYPAPNIDAAIHERKENPQVYKDFAASVRHVKERRHILGLVGGSGVSRIAGIQADLESDLRGITRPNSDATNRHHLPSNVKDKEIIRSNPKMVLKIDTEPVHIQEYQQWAYPSVIAPAPLEKETCYRPEKF